MKKKREENTKRFLEAARKVGVDESGKDFERAVEMILAPAKRPKKNNWHAPVSNTDRVVVTALLLVWARIGYEAALQHSKGDEFGFWIAVAIIVGFPLIAFIRPAAYSG